MGLKGSNDSNENGGKTMGQNEEERGEKAIIKLIRKRLKERV